MTRAQTRAQPRALPLRPDERGSLLLVSLLIVLVMAGLGLIAARNVMLELRQVGNYRTSEISQHISYSGVEGVMTRAAMDPSAFATFVVSNGAKVSMIDVSSVFYDVTANAGSFGKETDLVNHPANWVTTFTMPMTFTTVAGQPAPPGQSYTRYRIGTRGLWGPSAGLSVTTPDDVLRNAEREIVNYIYVGPI